MFILLVWLNSLTKSYYLIHCTKCSIVFLHEALHETFRPNFEYENKYKIGRNTIQDFSKWNYHCLYKTEYKMMYMINKNNKKDNMIKSKLCESGFFNDVFSLSVIVGRIFIWSISITL